MLCVSLPSAFAGDAASTVPSLRLPVACAMVERCVIQKLVDHDPTPERRDYMCGRLTTDGHDGVDIRLRAIADMARDVPVVAAASGTVLRVRDGMADRNVRELGQAQLQSRLAGNGVVIDHGGGWETQYSHLKQGSVAVRPGQSVKAGDRIGFVGMSGNAEFPHLHFEVRRNGATVDPFVGDGWAGGCGQAGQSLWAADARRQLAYVPSGILSVGFAQSPDEARIARDRPVSPNLQSAAPALILWADVFGARDGDTQIFQITDPSGQLIHDHQARIVRGGLSWVAYSGLRRPAGGWRQGNYTGRYQLIRDGRPVGHGVAVTKVD